jgi:hypothetical protein
MAHTIRTERLLRRVQGKVGFAPAGEPMLLAKPHGAAHVDVLLTRATFKASAQ